MWLYCMITSDISVALRKESVDRNNHWTPEQGGHRWVALRKESVDRNTDITRFVKSQRVALRKESVDRNGISTEYIS